MRWLFRSQINENRRKPNVILVYAVTGKGKSINQIACAQDIQLPVDVET